MAASQAPQFSTFSQTATGKVVQANFVFYGVPVKNALASCKKALAIFAMVRLNSDMEIAFTLDKVTTISELEEMVADGEGDIEVELGLDEGKGFVLLGW